jgi:hypothetical protein
MAQAADGGRFQTYYAIDIEERRKIHANADAQGWLSFGYVDKKKPAKLASMYRCDQCNSWRRSDTKEVVHESDGGRDWTVRCSRCFDSRSEDYNVIFHQDAHDDKGRYKMRAWTMHNSVLVVCTNQLWAVEDGIFEAYGITERAARRAYERHHPLKTAISSACTTTCTNN